MDAASWKRAEALIDAALGQDEQAQAAALLAACADQPDQLQEVIGVLLAALDAQGTQTPAYGPVDDTHRFEAANPESERVSDTGIAGIAGFELLSELGSGGMGVVYLAQQDGAVRRRVAMKVAHVPLGSTGRQRLTAERQMLARLSHPNIATLLEAGDSAAGHPYFAMELVEEAESLIDHCNRRRCDLRTRIALFLQVCAGVQYAHQQAVVHRDLKPNNLLISAQTSPAQVKIIDFGIARALEPGLRGSTLTGAAVLGTPNYMAPELLNFDSAPSTGSDTRSDIYSLGVILFELLVGALPQPRGRVESALTHVRRLAEQEPPTAAQGYAALSAEQRQAQAHQMATTAPALQRQLEGDLGWVIARAMARSPEQRYASVSELAADLQRYLHDEPVLAGPPTLRYHAGKFVKRYRYPLMAIAGVFLLLSIALVMRGVEVERANAATAQAQAAQASTERMVRFLSDLFVTADPQRHLGNELSAAEALRLGGERLLAGELEDSAQARARLLINIGVVHWRRGDPAAGLPLAERALAIQSQQTPVDQAELALATQVVGTLASEVGDYQRSEELLRRALAMRESLYGIDDARSIRTLVNLGAIHSETYRFEESIRIQREILDRLARTSGSESDQAQLAWGNLGSSLLRMRQSEPALAAQQRALQLAEQLFDERHPRVARAWRLLGEVHLERGELEQADGALNQALSRYRQLHQQAHPDLARCLLSVGDLRAAQSDRDAAIAAYGQAEQLYAQVQSRYRSLPLAHHALLLADAGELEAAAALAQTYVDQHEPYSAEPALDARVRMLLGPRARELIGSGTPLAQLAAAERP